MSEAQAGALNWCKPMQTQEIHENGGDRWASSHAGGPGFESLRAHHHSKRLTRFRHDNIDRFCSQLCQNCAKTPIDAFNCVKTFAALPPSCDRQFSRVSALWFIRDFFRPMFRDIEPPQRRWAPSANAPPSFSQQSSGSLTSLKDTGADVEDKRKMSGGSVNSADSC